MSEEEHRQPETVASGTYQQQASTLRGNGYVVIENRPCKIVQVSRIQIGKHGAPKCDITAIDMFTNKEFKILVPSSHTFDVPHVSHYVYHLIDISEDGSVRLQRESGNTNDYIKLPATENLLEQIKGAFAEGHDLDLRVLSAMGEEQITGFKVNDPK